MPCRRVPCQELPEPGRSGENVADAIANVTRAAGSRTPPRVERSAELDRGARGAPAPTPTSAPATGEQVLAIPAGARSAAPRTQRRAAVLDARAAAVLVVVAVGDRVRARDRARQMGLGDRHGADGARQLPADAGRVCPALRPRSPDWRSPTRSSWPTMVGATGVPLAPGNRIDILNNGDEFYPAMLDEIAHAQASITIEAYIYWAGEIGMVFAHALARSRTRGCAREDPARCGRVGAHRRRDPEDARRRAVSARLVQPDALVHHRAVQPPHAPQVAHRRRPDRIHGRRRHRRSLAGARAGCGPLARHADPHRGSRRHAAADRVRAELAADDRRAHLGPALLSAALRRPAGWRRRRS